MVTGPTLNQFPPNVKLPVPFTRVAPPVPVAPLPIPLKETNPVGTGWPETVAIVAVTVKLEAILTVEGFAEAVMLAGCWTVMLIGAAVAVLRLLSPL